MVYYIPYTQDKEPRHDRSHIPLHNHSRIHRSGVVYTKTRYSCMEEPMSEEKKTAVSYLMEGIDGKFWRSVKVAVAERGEKSIKSVIIRLLKQWLKEG